MILACCVDVGFVVGVLAVVTERGVNFPSVRICPGSFVSGYMTYSSEAFSPHKIGPS